MAFSIKMSQFAKFLVTAAFVIAGPAAAQEVVLKGKDSQLNISGTLISAAGGKFVVQTVIGEFEIEQALVTCEGPGCPQTREIIYDLNLVGSGDVAEVLIPIIAEGFASTLDAETILLDANGNPLDAETAAADLGDDNKIDIEIVDFDGEEIANFGVLEAEGMPAYEMLVSGAAQIIFSDERATRKVRDFVEDAGHGKLDSYEQDHIIAVEGFAVVVNPKNTVGAISIEQLAKVMSGQITDWSALGGPAGAINVYSYDVDTEAFAAIFELVLEPFDVTLTGDANIVRNSGELTTALMRDEAGIGLLNYHSRRETRALPLVNECGLTTYISPFTIKTEEYALGHRVHAYSRPDATGFTRDLLDYIDGPDLDGLVSKAGFVDLSVVADIQIDAAERTAAAAAATTDTDEKGIMDTLVQKQSEYERLSTTFRFAPGSENLDARGVRDLARLVTFMRTRKPFEAIAVGFTDNKGTFDANLLVGEQRATSVINLIKAAATEGALEGIEFSALGFGELSPVNCNASPRGRASNRRVEIWIK